MRLYSHPACLQHDPGPEHPEAPARLRAVLQALDAPRFAAITRCEAPPATSNAAMSARVGAISFPPDRFEDARKAADEIVAELRASYRAHGEQ